MNNLQRFLNGMAEGVIEQAERLEEESTDSDYVALNLRDYFSQLNAVAECTGDDERVDWPQLEDRIGTDIDPPKRSILRRLRRPA